MAVIVSKFLERIRVSAALPYIRGSILDLGCGYGAILSRMNPSDYLGVEGDPTVLHWLKAQFPDRRILQANLDADRLEVSQTFDTIVMLAVIEHLKHPGNILQQIPALLKPGGNLVITTPSPIGGKLHEAGAQFGIFSKLAMEDHETIFHQTSLSNLLAKYHLQVVKYKSFLLGGNQLFICKHRNW